MDVAVIAVFGTAAIGSSAAIVAAAADRFRKVVASSVALIAGLAPWVFLLALQGYIPDSKALSVFVQRYILNSDALSVFLQRYISNSNALALFGLFGSGPLFLVAFFLYCIGQRTPRRGVAAGASLIGMFAGGGFSIILSGLLSHME